MEVIKKESEVSLKYHMFKRLNTGGELLSAQEIRNCTIRLLGSDGIDFLSECSKNEDFKASIRFIGDDKFKTKYDQELVLRFFAIKNCLSDYKYPVTEFLTAFLEKITTREIEFDYSREKDIFEKTFSFINRLFGEKAFAGRTKNAFRSEFVLYYYDGISIAIANNIEELQSENDLEQIESLIESIKFGDELQAYKTGSVNGVKARIKLFNEGVQKTLGSGDVKS